MTWKVITQQISLTVIPLRLTILLVTEPGKRNFAIDALRGLTLLFMVPINTGLYFFNGPQWLKHSPGPGLRLADFVMPSFLVAMGLSSSLSVHKRFARDGFWKTTLHAFLRYAILFAMGTIGYFLVWEGQSWEVLQMLGATGAFAFLFLFIPPVPRIFSAFALMGIVELLRAPFFNSAYSAWYESGLGGPAGTFALSFLAILASALGELWLDIPWKRRALSFGLSGGILVGLGFVAAQLAPADKHMLTPAFLLQTGGTAFLILALCEIPCSRFGDLPLLGSLGRNPLFGYIGSGLLILLVRVFISATTPSFLAWIAMIAVTAIIAGMAIFLDRKRIWIKL